MKRLVALLLSGCAAQRTAAELPPAPVQARTEPAPLRSLELEELRATLEAEKPKGDFSLRCRAHDTALESLSKQFEPCGGARPPLPFFELSVERQKGQLAIEVEPKEAGGCWRCKPGGTARCENPAEQLAALITDSARALRSALSMWGRPLLEGVPLKAPIAIRRDPLGHPLSASFDGESTGPVRLELLTTRAGATIKKAELTAKGTNVVIGFDYQSLGPALVPLWIRLDPVGEAVAHRLELSDCKLGPIELRPSAPAPAIDPGERATAADLEAVIALRRKELQSCYDEQLAREPALAGLLRVELVIEESGQVSEVSVTEDTLSSPSVSECISARLRTWRFRPPATGAVALEVPLRFAPPR